MLTLDITFVVQIISFLVLWVGLKHLLFDPFLQVLEQRDARTAGVGREAAATRTRADAAAAEYERRMQEVRQALAADAEAARAATQTAEREVLSAAHAHAGTRLAQLRDSLQRQTTAVRPALAGEARELATRMMERVVGRRLA